MKDSDDTVCNITTVINPPEPLIGNGTFNWLIGNVTLVTSTETPGRNCTSNKDDGEIQCWETMIGQVSRKVKNINQYMYKK